MDEKRAVRRQRTIKGAHIVFNNGRSSIDCIIRDQSENGAMLKVVNGADIPDQFDLVVADDEPVRGCRVIEDFKKTSRRVWRQSHRTRASSPTV